MKIEARFRPELCVSQDETRYTIMEPWLDATEQKVISTDGHMLVAVPVETSPGEASGYIGSRQLGMARGDDAKASGTFPDWKAAIPKLHEGDPGTATVGLNAKYLFAMAKALGTDKGQVVITFRLDGTQATEEPILVRSGRSDYDVDDGAVGVLMPLRIRLRTRSAEKPLHDADPTVR